MNKLRVKWTSQHECRDCVHPVWESLTAWVRFRDNSCRNCNKWNTSRNVRPVQKLSPPPLNGSSRGVLSSGVHRQPWVSQWPTWVTYFLHTSTAQSLEIWHLCMVLVTHLALGKRLVRTEWAAFFPALLFFPQERSRINTFFFSLFSASMLKDGHIIRLINIPKNSRWLIWTKCKY